MLMLASNLFLEPKTRGKKWPGGIYPSALTHDIFKHILSEFSNHLIGLVNDLLPECEHEYFNSRSCQTTLYNHQFGETVHLYLFYVDNEPSRRRLFLVKQHAVTAYRHN